MNVLVSVIIPLFNKENSILETVNSVLKQSFTDFELIIVDDGSSDSSAKIVSGLSDSRISLYTKSNGGVSSARNYGCSKAIGDYIFFLDADDTISSTCLKELYDLTKEYPLANLYCCNFTLNHGNGVAIPYSIYETRGYIHDSYKSLCLKHYLPRCGAMLVRRIDLLEVGLFDEKLSHFEDLKLILALLDQCCVAYTPLALMYYNLVFSSLSSLPSNIENSFAYNIKLSFSNNCYKNKYLLRIYLFVLYGLFRSGKISQFFKLLNRNLLFIFLLLK